MIALLLAAVLSSAPSDFRSGVVIEPSPAWTQAELSALEEELQALPPELTHPPGGVLVLHRETESAPFGMGDGTSAHPDWSDNGRVFHLYAFASGGEARAERFSRLLPGAEQVRLWRRRALVHALIRRFDQAHHWSESPEFRRISGWLHPFERPLTWHEEAQNVFEGAYSRRRGQVSAALDLATFAEEALVPISSVHPGLVPVDDQVRCQEFSKWRFLFGALTDAGLIPVGDPRAARGECPAFDGWADPSTLDHAEVLYVAASGRAPESLFGHLLLRLVRKPGPLVDGPSFGTAVQLVALTGSESPDIRYLVRGLTGGYRLGVMTTPMAEIAHDTLENEQRSIRRFRLVLSPAEQTRLLERVWELERRGYLDYWFLSDNCGTALAFLVQGALDDGREIRLPSRFSPVLPSAVLDALAQAGVLELEPGSFESIRDRAARAERERTVASEAVRRALTVPQARTDFEITDARLHAPELAVRKTGVLRLETWTKRWASTLTEDARRQLSAYWRATVGVERYAVERATAEKREVLIRAIDPSAIQQTSASDWVAARQQEFLHESQIDRRLASLDRVAAMELALARAPRRPLTSSEQDVVDHADASARAFTELTAAHGRVVDAVFSEQEPVALLAHERSIRQRNELEFAHQAQSRSGFARFAAGGALDNAGTWMLAVHSAFLEERWGDQRVHGFQSKSGTQVLAGDLLVAPRLGLPEIVRSDLTLIGYRTLQREVPTFRRTPLDAVGWGARLRWDSDVARAQRDRTTLDAELYLVADSTPDARRFTALGFGVSTQVRWSSVSPDALRPLAGPELVLAQRFPLGSELANALRLDARYRPAFGAGGWVHEVEAEAGLDLRAQAGARSFLIEPRATLIWEQDPRSTLRRSLTVGVWVEPL